jgi:hypothetical protein
MVKVEAGYLGVSRQVKKWTVKLFFYERKGYVDYR